MVDTISIELWERVKFYSDDILIGTYTNAGADQTGVYSLGLNQNTFESVYLSQVSNGYDFGIDVSFTRSSPIIYWSSSVRVAKVDIHTKINTDLKTSSQNSLFNTLSISPDEKRILYSRKDRWPAPTNCQIGTRQYLYIMDVNGEGEMRVKLPE